MRNQLQNIASFYNPFGMSMMSYSNEEFVYSYGMNTQEKDDEIYGEGNSYSAEYWQYDARLGRRWNVDPKSNPSVSVYACFGNNPIWCVDVFGDTAIVVDIKTGQEIERFDDGNLYNTHTRVNKEFYLEFREKFTEAHELNSIATLTSQITGSNGLLNTFFNELKEEANFLNWRLNGNKLIDPPCSNYEWNNDIQLFGSHLLSNEISTTMEFDGNTLSWVSTFEDGKKMTKYSWGANSGPHKYGMLPNGFWMVKKHRYSRKEKGYKVPGTNFGFTFELKNLFAFKCSAGAAIRCDFRIHPDGSPPGTAGCIGLTDNEAVLRQMRDMLWQYLSNNNNQMIIIITIPNNPNNHCQSGKKNGKVCN